MKTLKFVSQYVVAIGAIGLLLFACEDNPETVPQEDILPESFSVNIPSSISNNNVSSGGRTSGRMSEHDETFHGNDIYEGLATFIWIGEAASEIVEEIILALRIYNINKEFTLTYESDDDNRTKNLVVEENSEFEGTTWQFQLTITDAESEGNADGGKAMQLFWNTNPVKGIAILKPFNIDRLHDAEAGEAIFRIDYSEGGELGYDAHMLVGISNLPLEDPEVDPFSVRTLRMFAGKTGNVVDVYGNSHHPNAQFFTPDVGFNWAFVASGNEVTDIGVAEVGLPPSDLDETDREVLLEEYSIKNVFTEAINIAFPGIAPEFIEAYLVNTDAPGYFEKDGFISGGVSPGTDWDVLAARLTDLSPYNPLETSELEIVFK